jgi:hypothetical protein
VPPSCSRSRHPRSTVRGDPRDGRRKAAGAGLLPGAGGLGVRLRRLAQPAASARAVRHAWLTDAIRQVHAAARQTYGARRVHAELTLGRGIGVGYHAVELLMRRAGLQGVTGRPKFRRGLRPRRPPATWSTASSLAPAPISCGSPTSPSTPARASCTARWSWTPAHAGWSAGPSTPPRRRRW